MLVRETRSDELGEGELELGERVPLRAALEEAVAAQIGGRIAATDAGTA